jgi:hypothetical protein
VNSFSAQRMRRRCILSDVTINRHQAQSIERPSQCIEHATEHLGTGTRQRRTVTSGDFAAHMKTGGIAQWHQ